MRICGGFEAFFGCGKGGKGVCPNVATPPCRMTANILGDFGYFLPIYTYVARVARGIYIIRMRVNMGNLVYITRVIRVA